MASELGADDALADANDRFHAAYERSLDLQPNGPVIVLLNGELVIRNGAVRRAFPLESGEFTAAKIAAHLTVATFLLANDEERLRPTVQRVDSMLEACSRGEPTRLRTAMRTLLEASQRFGSRALQDGPLGERARSEFAASTREGLLRLTELATEAELIALHDATRAALSSLSERERETLEIVVAGNHQARSRSLGMQYFARRLGEEEGEERRVAYGENIETEDEALELVATRRLDRELAAAFFGDERRMQRDLLADAATRCLDRMNLDEPGTGRPSDSPRNDPNANDTKRELGFLRRNGLSLMAGALFVASLSGQLATGFFAHNAELEDHGAASLSFFQYLASGHCIEAIFENWESEFLQMALFVVLTVMLRQQGSSESKNLDAPEAVDEEPRKHRDEADAPWPVRHGGLALGMYRHSLSTAFFALFVSSFALHAFGGLRAANAERALHGLSAQTAWEFVSSAE
ncbi:MAG TPA: DUF6766 family protein, partial [Polyangiaceae bacterium]|nr:DUF6766 family protein [Polyangiaceae bacterium]